MARLIDRSPLSRMHDRDAELAKLGSIRFVVGIVCIARLVPNLWASLYLYQPGSNGALSPFVTEGLWVLGLTAIVTIGLLTPLALPALVVSMRAHEMESNSDSLVTDMASFVLTFLFLSGAGSSRSIDAWLLRRPGFPGAIVRALYRVAGAPSREGLQRVYMLFFLGYGLIHLGGAMYHWHTEAWRSGDALAMVSSSSYLARFWKVYRAAETSWPGLAHAVSASATFVQLLMQTLTIPLMFWRRTVPVAIAWGFVFTVASMVLLQLNYLGMFEFLLWFTLFHRPRSTPVIVATPQRSPAVDAVLTAFGTGTLVVFLIHEVGEAAELLPRRDERLTRAFATVGLHAPDVFNRDDLRLGDIWVVMFSPDREMLPFNGPDGERLAWTQWSDLLFYGLGNRWRAGFNERALFDRSGDGLARLQQLALFDHRRRHANEGRYVVDYYRSRASYVHEPPAGRFARVHVGSLTIVCSGAAVDAACAVEETSGTPR